MPCLPWYKEELLDNVWGNRFVSESTLTSRVKGARRAVGDDGRSQRIIRTVHGRGYQFVAQVEVDGTVLNGVPREAHPPDASVLAVSVTRLIGREQELSVLVDLMSGTRLLTLTGPGGVGKTRLAAELASRVADRNPDGVLYWGAPNVKQPGFRWITPGSLLAVLLWILASAAFAVYVANFGNYNEHTGLWPV